MVASQEYLLALLKLICFIDISIGIIQLYKFIQMPYMFWKTIQELDTRVMTGLFLCPILIKVVKLQ